VSDGDQTLNQFARYGLFAEKTATAATPHSLQKFVSPALHVG
jgi:hypothetical protein